MPLYHKYPSAIWTPSPNFYPGRSAAIDRIVVHITDGGSDLQGAAAHQYRPDGLAAHFLVGQLGEILQLVDLGDAAKHASGYNQRSVGIEHCARTPGELDRHWPSIGLHSRRVLSPQADPDSTTDPGLPLSDAQLEASAALVRWLLRELQLPTSAVIPHCEVPETTHLDCGRDVGHGGIWPWVRYKALLGVIG